MAIAQQIRDLITQPTSGMVRFRGWKEGVEANSLKEGVDGVIFVAHLHTSQ